eukprot:CAMPEP_0185779396 /NCGR_PEP_ID=MMETSP1174-20130828/95721_1 /TAXON_ID=35687 /ORGANISM="Dictyocha speculum, Strain CCMP1381" /LENGTH=154 /DNA_ID=CAMNT_0028468541 /DNA_START=268 /DNA_END=732 /DNA_ORIENTATION=-
MTATEITALRFLSRGRSMEEMVVELRVVSHGPILAMLACHQLIQQLAGRWERYWVEVGAGYARKKEYSFRDSYFDGLEIATDGSYILRNGVSDGLVQEIGGITKRQGTRAYGSFKLKRSCRNANDHPFTLREDGLNIDGFCLQSRSKWHLRKMQ